MANESKPENVDDNSVTNGSRTSFIISSTPTRNSQEDNSTASAVQDTTESRFFLPPWGTVFCIMASFGFCCAFTLRVSLSVAIVAMVNQTAISDDHVVTTNISDTDQCPRDQELERADGELTWDRHQQGTALAAFYYGLIVTQVIIAKKHKFCDRMAVMLILVLVLKESLRTNFKTLSLSFPVQPSKFLDESLETESH